jgi:hypothetical protein
MTKPKITPKLAGWTAVLAVLAIAIAVALLMTDLGADVIARVRCAGVWATTDATAYRACADFEPADSRAAPSHARGLDAAFIAADGAILDAPPDICRLL